jgi:hypothetical protein
LPCLLPINKSVKDKEDVYEGARVGVGSVASAVCSYFDRELGTRTCPYLL